MTARIGKTCKTGLLLMAGALFAFALVTPSAAGFAQNGSDNVQLMNRINQLENQVQTLSRSVYRGGQAPVAAPVSGVESAPLSGPAMGAYDDRLSQLESQQREMTGRLEQLTHEVMQVKDRLEKMQADTELRFSQAGAGGSSSVAPSPSISTTSDRTPVLTGDLYATESGSSGVLGGMSSGAESLYETAFADIREAKYDSAQVKFGEFMKKYPNHPLAANAQYWLAETHYVRGDHRTAAKLFAQGYQDYPQGPKAADCLLKLGLSLAKLGKKDDACLSLQQLQKEFPSASNPANRRGAQEMDTLGCK